MRKVQKLLASLFLGLTPLLVLANEVDDAKLKTTKAAAGIAIMFVLFLLILLLAIYIYYAICLIKLANKTNTPNAWLAWIPIANVYLTIKIAGKESWWFVLFFVPLVNIVISVLVWMEISKKLGKPDWLGILIIVPIANIVLPGYLAFSKVETATPTQQQPQA